jgi:hypothetical protein
MRMNPREMKATEPKNPISCRPKNTIDDPNLPDYTLLLHL